MNIRINNNLSECIIVCIDLGFEMNLEKGYEKSKFIQLKKGRITFIDSEHLVKGEVITLDELLEETCIELQNIVSCKKVESMIKFSNISKFLTGNPTYIRKDKIPHKYEDCINELLQLVEGWKTKHENTFKK